MKNFTLFVVALLFAFSGVKAQVSHTISVSGFAYDPNDLTINAGDTVIFAGNDTHPLVQVSEDTWNANGNTPLDGGFSFPEGSGTVTFDSADTIFYVCTVHVASNGMKGKITVSAPTGIRDISDAGFSVYPLPLTGNELTVAFKNQENKNVQIHIYDLAGNLRITDIGVTANGIYKVDCSILPKGLFLMKVNAGGENMVSKIVRE